MKKSALFGMVLALALLASCSFSPEEAVVSRSLELADLTLVNAHYVLKDKGQPPLFIEAEEIALYEKKHTALLSAATFSRQDESGATTLIGRADHIEANTESWDARLEGNIVVEDLTEALVIHASSLHWLYDEQLLFSSADELVHLSHEGDKQVDGYGLEAHLGEATFRFDRIVKGVIGE